MQSKIVIDFIHAINDHDVKKITALSTSDHAFIDSSGNAIHNTDKLTAAWKAYFESFPDYKIEIINTFENGNNIALFGFASGTYKGVKTENNSNYWRIPASWLAVVDGNYIKSWQVFADTKTPYDIINAFEDGDHKEKRVTGLGGVFFKCKDPDAIKSWYQKHLGFTVDNYGTSFEWRQADSGIKKGFTAWSPFKETTSYFQPSEKEFMINYRVVNMDGLIEKLRNEGVTICDAVESFEYGKFIHIMDPEGNKIELWEANDEEYDKILEVRTK